jgi:hypothetical protein
MVQNSSLKSTAVDKGDLEMTVSKEITGWLIVRLCKDGFFHRVDGSKEGYYGSVVQAGVDKVVTVTKIKEN